MRLTLWELAMECEPSFQALDYWMVSAFLQRSTLSNPDNIASGFAADLPSSRSWNANAAHYRFKCSPELSTLRINSKCESRQSFFHRCNILSGTLWLVISYNEQYHKWFDVPVWGFTYVNFMKRTLAPPDNMLFEWFYSEICLIQSLDREWLRIRLPKDIYHILPNRRI